MLHKFSANSRVILQPIIDFCLFFFHQNSPNASRTIQNPSRTPQPPQSHKNSPKTLQPQIPIFTKKVGKVILGGIPGNWGLQGGIWGSQWGREVRTLFLSFLTLRSPTKTPPKPKFWWKRKGGAVTQGGFWGGLEFRAAFGGSRGQKEDIAVWQLGQQWKSWTHDFQTLVLGCTRLKLNFFSFNLEYFFSFGRHPFQNKSKSDNVKVKKLFSSVRSNML